MKALKIFEEAYEKEVIEKNFSRREALTKGLGLGLKTALAAVPFGLLDALGNKAQAAPSNPDIIKILNYALTLEYLEDTFYKTGLSTNGLIAATDTTIFMQISKHETAHVALLKTTITALGGTPVAEPTFDFTGGGQFPDVFTSYQRFMGLSVAFEDLGVRAYKGQAVNLLGAKDVLAAALNIHSVEARHASEVRRLRGSKGWITIAEADGLPGFIYDGEENTVQLGIDVTSITSVDINAVTQAFDEPLAMPPVLTIVGPFIKQ
ncbi:MAG TPA: ferritin-like domain-containing protein [Puia sp.]|nr:ferritin-like domain-containing protein [Puia sp.]